MRRGRSGFTLAEVAVTLVIVAGGLLYVLQMINQAKLSAARARNLKLARELALLTLGRIESGLYTEEIRGQRLGPFTYAEEGYDYIEYEVVFGDEDFLQRDEYGAFDSWAPTDQELEQDRSEETEEPFEEVEIKVTFPGPRGMKNDLVLVRNVPWNQVYGAPEDEDQGEAPAEGTR